MFWPELKNTIAGWNIQHVMVWDVVVVDVRGILFMWPSALQYQPFNKEFFWDMTFLFFHFKNNWGQSMWPTDRQIDELFDMGVSVLYFC